MQQLSNLDLFFLIPELKKFEGIFLGNVYGREGVFKLKFRSSSLIINPKNAIYVSNHVFESEEPRGFVRILRDELSNQKLIEVSQINLDRVCNFKFSNSTLIIELATSNIILMDGDTIKACLKESERIKKGGNYSPLKVKKNPLEVEAADFEKLKGNVVAATSKVINLSAFYLEEACVRADVSGDISSLSNKEREKLALAIKSVFEIKEPRVYYEDGAPKFFSSIPLKKLSLEFKSFENLNDALDEYYSNQVKVNEKLLKLKFKLEQQKKALEEFKQKAKENREKGEAIYSKYSFIEGILKNPEEAIKEGKAKLITKGREISIEV